MQHTSARFKRTLTWSTAMFLTFISIDKVWGDDAIDSESKTSQATVENLNSNLAELKANLSKNGENLSTDMKKLNELKQAILVEQNRLQELHESKKTAQVLAAIIKIHKEEAERFENKLTEERAQFEKDMENKKALLDKKKSELEITYNELKAKLGRNPSPLEITPVVAEKPLIQEEVITEAKTTPTVETKISAEILPPPLEIIPTAEKQPLIQEKVMKNAKTNPRLRVKPETVMTKAKINPTLEAIPTPKEVIPLTANNSSSENIVNLSSVQKGRSPLGILESNHDLRSQQWYLYSSAKRGIRKPNDVIEIVSVVGENDVPHRGEEAKALLIEKGIRPENIKIVAAKGEETQVGKIYIYKM